jgi:hypothetical protein
MAQDRVASSAYRPGACNIGPAEIARRLRTGHVGAVATIVLLIVLVVTGLPPILRLLLFLPAAVSAAGYLQAWLKFCARFGAVGVFNFDAVGMTEPVIDEAARRRDRRTARMIGLGSFLIGLAVAAGALLLPL